MAISPGGLPHDQRDALMRAAHLGTDLPQRQALGLQPQRSCRCSTVRCASLGVDVQRLRRNLFVVTSLMVGVAVAVSG
jgi:hypothetical protein